jgi:hypothetical protein
MRPAHRKKWNTWRDAAPLALPILALLLIALVEWGTPESFVSHEVTFTDRSPDGLAIMPASCASDPAQFHTSLPATSDGKGYTRAPGTSQRGATKNGVSICTTNTTASTFFIPANTAAEMNSVKVGWTKCANENLTCSFSGTKWVIYGVSDGLTSFDKSGVWENGGWKWGQFTNSVPCTNAAFGGNPTPNIVSAKACYYTNSTWFIPGFVVF